MAKAEDLSGKIFGYLRVKERVNDHISKSGQKKVCWLCECQLCGNESSDVSIKDFNIVNYDYGFTTIDTSMSIGSVDEIIKNCLSYSFVFGPNSQRNFSYTKL